MSVCTNKTHQRYSDAIEGLYLQVWIAHRDLTNLLDGAPDNAADSHDKGVDLLLKFHKVDEVVDRIAFGKKQYDEANSKVERHIARGCKALEEVWRPIEPTHEQREGA